jgi:tartrate dehydrogenase/decarboxylase/D-malate dehydrogenase
MTAARRLRIATIPGDGIGAEVLSAGCEVLEAAIRPCEAAHLEWVALPWGSDYYGRTGSMMPGDGLDRLREFDAIYFGAVGWPSVPDHVSLWGLRLAICQGLDLWSNVRPVRFYPGVTGPLRRDTAGLGWITVRENSEGEYAGVGGRNLSARGAGGEVALETAVFTEVGCERIMRYAFELAAAREDARLTSVTKSNAQRFGMVLWDETFQRVARDFPDVETDSVLVDAMAARMVLRPESLSVVVASNLHADILSDLGSALAGSLGLGASGNIDPDGRAPSMFEPVHGSAPDIAGRGVANPIGAIASGAMMLEHLGLADAARRIERATAEVLGAGTLPADLGGTAKTTEVTNAVATALRAA